MSKTLIALLLISLVSVSQQAAANTFTCKVGASTTNNGVWDAPTGITGGATCIVPGTGGTATCKIGYSDAVTSGTAASTATNVARDCFVCATADYKLSGPAGATGVTCVDGTAGGAGVCISVFTDKVNGGTPAVAADALAADCMYCPTATPKFDRPYSVIGVTCVAATAACQTGYINDRPTSVAGVQCIEPSGSCHTGYIKDRPYGVTGVACVDATTGACAAGFTDSSSGAAATAAGTVKTECKYCLSGKKFDQTWTNTGAACVDQSAACATGYINDRPTSLSAVACVDKTAGSCFNGYTDSSTGAAATAAATAKAGDCKYCLTGSIFDRASTASGAACVDKTSGTCFAGYTDSSTGAAATGTGTAKAGDCKYCLTSTHIFDRISTVSGAICVDKTAGSCAPGYTDKSDGSAATAAATAKAGDCKYCAVATQVFDRVSNLTDATCIAIASGSCAAGYTDKNGVATGNSTVSLASACTYCAEGYKDTAGNTGKTTAATTACTKTTTDTPAAGTGSGNYLQGFVCLIFVILSILI